MDNGIKNIFSNSERVGKALLQFFGDNAVSFIDVDDFVSQIPEDDDSIEVRIHCPGGDVAEGWAIVDKLRATGKK